MSLDDVQELVWIRPVTPLEFSTQLFLLLVKVRCAFHPVFDLTFWFLKPIRETNMVWLDSGPHSRNKLSVKFSFARKRSILKHECVSFDFSWGLVIALIIFFRRNGTTHSWAWVFVQVVVRIFTQYFLPGLIYPQEGTTAFGILIWTLIRTIIVLVDERDISISLVVSHFIISISFVSIVSLHPVFTIGYLEHRKWMHSTRIVESDVWINIESTQSLWTNCGRTRKHLWGQRFWGVITSVNLMSWFKDESCLIVSWLVFFFRMERKFFLYSTSILLIITPPLFVENLHKTITLLCQLNKLQPENWVCLTCHRLVSCSDDRSDDIP